MTPFMLIIMVIWPIANPAAPTDTQAVIIREVFPDHEICEAAKSVHIEEANDTYIGARVEGWCKPAGPAI